MPRNVCGITSKPDRSFVIIGGTATLFAIPGSSDNLADGINNLDQCVGFYVLERTAAGFRRDADGTLTYPITAPGSTYHQPWPALTTLDRWLG